jgi:catechol 2,3-dioxygenase-like lactoylglutathione lyase family enzyme
LRYDPARQQPLDGAIMTPDTPFRLEHVNMPARDPEALARWYADTLGLRADAHRVRGDGVLLVFQKGPPVGREELHIGLRVPSFTVLKEWALRLGSTITPGAEFTSLRVNDPEGNVVEIYCKTEG